MILYPAIDLKDGQCVRLLHGDMDKATKTIDEAAEAFEGNSSVKQLQEKIHGR